MSSSQTPDRGSKDNERFRRDRPHLAPEAVQPGNKPGPGALANPWPDFLGIWSADGRSLSQQGLNDNLRATERLMQGWQLSLETQRATMDALRDLFRKQQDLLLASSMALLGAALNLEGSQRSNPDASAMEQAAANCGSAWRRTLDAGLANCWAGFEIAAAAANTPEQKGGAQSERVA